MHLRNGEHGYGAVTKLLHWLTVLAVVAQFAVGWTMSGDEAADRAKDRLEQAEERTEAEIDRLEVQGRDEEADRLEEPLDAQQDAADDRVDAELDDQEDGPSTLHVVLGLSIIGLALVRLLWRRTTPLPPWAEHLSSGERTLQHWLEKLLLTMLVVTPATGLLLVAGQDDLLPLHIAGQVALLALIAVHVGLVLSHTVVRRNRHLSRML